MTDSQPTESPTITLLCTGGTPPPPEVAQDLQELANLPAAAKEHFWDALGPSLRQPLPDSLDRTLDRFCEQYDVPGGKLSRVIKACRFLLRQAAARDLDEAKLREDIGTLAGEQADEVGPILAAGYEQAKGEICVEFIRGSIADHGKLLVGLDWRIDAMVASQRAMSLKAPVALLTLHFREGERTERITLQALPDTLRQLREACDRMLR